MALPAGAFDKSNETPFEIFPDDPPQVAAIKKVINSLYYAEVALKTWEELKEKNLWGKTLHARQGVIALTHVYNSLALLNEETHEIQAIIVTNFALIQPIFSGAFELIKTSNWLLQFKKMDVVTTASAVLQQDINQAGSESQPPKAANPVFLFLRRSRN